MAIVGNRAYNNPAIGQAMQNIAGLFAPPDSAELVNYAQAAGLRQKTGHLAQLFNNPTDPHFDRRNIAVGNYAPTQSFYAQDQNNATTMRGQDVTAATSRANNLQTNQFGAISDMYGPLNPGQVRPELPGPMTDFMGLPAMPATAGTPKPLSESEVEGDLLLKAIEEGLLGPADAAGAYKSDINIENVVTPDGPKIVTRSDAIGQEPFFNKGAEAKPENAIGILPDGKTQVPAIQGEDGRWYNAQTGEVLPPDIRIQKLPQAQGTAEEVGLSRPTNSFIEKELINIASTRGAATDLRDLIASAPASQGAVGFLRSSVQDVVQVGGELGKFLGGAVAEVNEDITNGFTDAGLAGEFDPNLPAIEAMSNFLTWQYAKTMVGDRVSNEAYRAAKESLGLQGIGSNQASSIARLEQVIEQLDRQETMLRRTREGGVDAINGQPGVPMASAEGVPPGWDPEDWKYLEPEEQQQVLSGQ